MTQRQLELNRNRDRIINRLNAKPAEHLKATAVPIDEHTLVATYDEWKSIGRTVLKGQKAVTCNQQGKPAFNKNQTIEIELLAYWKNII